MRSTIVLSIIFFLCAAPVSAHSNLCSPKEMVVLSCKVKDGKILSLCASPDLSETNGTLHYRFGRPGAVELSYPQGDGHPRTMFRRGPIGSGFGEFVRFTQAGATYTVEYADGPRVRGGIHAGVMIHKGTKRVAWVSCASGPETILGPELFTPVYRAKLPSEQRDDYLEESPIHYFK
jgi:hypothetical protein